ncbi:MAG: ABC transporter substrate-binding protein [Betaproteobacteria bacterium]
MRRREFLAITSSTALMFSRSVDAQNTVTPRRIGVLMSVNENDPEGWAQFSGFKQQLADLGWTDGRNLRMEVRWGGGNVNQISLLAKELVSLRPDLIVAQGTPVTAALHRETRTIPIVFVVVTDPVGEGFVTALSRPGGNNTGFLTSEAAIGAKMLELLIEIAPSVKRVAMLFNPDTAPGAGMYYYRDFEAAAKSSNVEPVPARARNDAEIESVVTSLGAFRGGLIVMPDFFMLNHVGPIITLAARNNVPAIYPWRYAVAKDGGLLSYGPDLRDIVRRGAIYVDRILRGAKPADLPVQVPVKWEMAVNVKTAKALSLTVPSSIRIRADEVVE